MWMYILFVLPLVSQAIFYQSSTIFENEDHAIHGGPVSTIDSKFNDPSVNNVESLLRRESNIDRIRRSVPVRVHTSQAIDSSPTNRTIFYNSDHTNKTISYNNLVSPKIFYKSSPDQTIFYKSDATPKIFYKSSPDQAVFYKSNSGPKNHQSHQAIFYRNKHNPTIFYKNTAAYGAADSQDQRIFYKNSQQDKLQKPISSFVPLRTRRSSTSRAIFYSSRSPSAEALLSEDANVTLPVRERRAYFSKGARPFPDGKIHYVFEDGVAEKTESMVLNTMKKIMRLVPCIKFLEVTSANQASVPHTLLISDKHPGCKVTKVGYRGEWHRSTLLNVQYDRCLKEGVIQHELMHVLGAVHSHTRPDRDQYVEVHFDNIRPGFTKQFVKVRTAVDKDDYRYDYKSAMHYGPRYFAIDDSKPVITTKLPFKEEFSASQTFSPHDIRSLRDWYGCGKRCPFDQSDCHLSERLKNWHAETKIDDFDTRDKLEASDSLLNKLDLLLSGNDSEGGTQRMVRRVSFRVPDGTFERSMMPVEKRAESCNIGTSYYSNGCKHAENAGSLNQKELCEDALLSNCDLPRPFHNLHKRGAVSEDVISRNITIVKGSDAVLAVWTPSNTTVEWFDGSTLLDPEDTATVDPAFHTLHLGNVTNPPAISTLIHSHPTPVRVKWNITLIPPPAVEWLSESREFLQHWLAQLLL